MLVSTEIFLSFCSHVLHDLPFEFIHDHLGFLLASVLQIFEGLDLYYQREGIGSKFLIKIFIDPLYFTSPHTDCSLLRGGTMKIGRQESAKN